MHKRRHGFTLRVRRDWKDARQPVRRIRAGLRCCRQLARIALTQWRDDTYAVVLQCSLVMHRPASSLCQMPKITNWDAYGQAAWHHGRAADTELRLIQGELN